MRLISFYDPGVEHSRRSRSHHGLPRLLSGTSLHQRRKDVGVKNDHSSLSSKVIDARDTRHCFASNWNPVPANNDAVGVPSPTNLEEGAPRHRLTGMRALAPPEVDSAKKNGG
jgi:hypothetical protein